MSKKNPTSITPEDLFRSPRLCPTRYNTSANYQLDFDSDAHVEYNDSPSLTVPNDSYSVQELLIRHLSGSLPDISKEFYYDTDVQDPSCFDNIDPTMSPDFDLADYHALSNDLASRKASRSVPKDSLPQVTKEEAPDSSTEVVTENSIDK